MTSSERLYKKSLRMSGKRIAKRQKHLAKFLNLGAFQKDRDIHVTGLENLPSIEEQAFIFVKHLDNADPLQALKVLHDHYDNKAPFRIQAKKELFFPPLGWYLKRLGGFPVVQKYKDKKQAGEQRTSYSADLTKGQAQILKATPNGKMVSYPEGHRYPDGVGPMMSGGIYAMAEYAAQNDVTVKGYIVGLASDKEVEQKWIFRKRGRKLGMHVLKETFEVGPELLALMQADSPEALAEKTSVKDEQKLKLGRLMLEASNIACENIGVPSIDNVPMKPKHAA